LGPDHPDVATSLNNLAELYGTQGKYAEAEPLYNRALEIDEKFLGSDHPTTTTIRNNLAEIYKKMGEDEEAKKLEESSPESLDLKTVLALVAFSAVYIFGRKIA